MGRYSAGFDRFESITNICVLGRSIDIKFASWIDSLLVVLIFLELRAVGRQSIDSLLGIASGINRRRLIL